MTLKIISCGSFSLTVAHWCIQKLFCLRHLSIHLQLRILHFLELGHIQVLCFGHRCERCTDFGSQGTNTCCYMYSVHYQEPEKCTFWHFGYFLSHVACYETYHHDHQCVLINVNTVTRRQFWGRYSWIGGAVCVLVSFKETASQEAWRSASTSHATYWCCALFAFFCFIAFSHV